MKKNILCVLLISVLLILASCTNINKNANISTEIKITDWDNSKYEGYNEMFENSIGLNVENSNSFNIAKDEEKSMYKELNTLYIDDINDSISLKFNNNGKTRNFILTVFYDYQQIPFKISDDNNYDISYKFELDTGKEIELPLYLSEDVDKDNGIHKLLISFTIWYDIHAGDYEDKSTWYGYSQTYDVIYNENEMFIDTPNNITHTDIDKTIDLMYNFEINKDYAYSILESNILPSMETLITTNKNDEVKLMYNVSATEIDTEDLLILLTVDFNQTIINNKPYELIKLPKGKTGIGEINFMAPDKEGKYEVIAYLIYNPFQQNQLTSHSIVSSAQRFTLEVK